MANKITAESVVGDTGWIDTADVARLIRQELSDEFPSHAWKDIIGPRPFKVRTERYAGGSSIDITLPKLSRQNLTRQELSDEFPNHAWRLLRSLVIKVADLADKYQGQHFDGMQDLAYTSPITVNGKLYRTGCYVFVRSHSGYSVTQRTWLAAADEYDGYSREERVQITRAVDDEEE